MNTVDTSWWLTVVCFHPDVDEEDYDEDAAPGDEEEEEGEEDEEENEEEEEEDLSGEVGTKWINQTLYLCNKHGWVCDTCT